jgi:hypothetical protein
MIVLHHYPTGTEFIAAQESGEIVEIRPHRINTGSTIVYRDGGTVSVRESPMEVMLLLQLQGGG